jgi:hypothetical protein
MIIKTIEVSIKCIKEIRFLWLLLYPEPITICLAYKTKDMVGTLAQRLMITEKQYNIKDKIYKQ